MGIKFAALQFLENSTGNLLFHQALGFFSFGKCFYFLVQELHAAVFK